MLTTDEDALICDLAETYHIFDWTALPLVTVARLASGLRDDARIMMKLSGQKVSTEKLLLAMIADNTGFVAWSKTEAAEKHPGRPPERIAPILLGVAEPAANRNKVMSFSSPEAFEKALADIRSNANGSS